MLKPEQESVWDYPRPPRLEPSHKKVQVVCNEIIIADTQSSQRVLETSHPPVYYIPQSDIQMQYLAPSNRQSFCEWKGIAIYYSIIFENKSISNCGWSYPDPTPEFINITDYIAFYPSLMDACYVDGELVTPQPGNFYGGWITQDIIGPFKG
ncbi:DUF427 domain-containing protein [Gloeocapsa sp. PCC 73106]|uniref:DUF427 domain-containing protein n=1 Tax=Gloeocapsa sp. PCC 73106 TaxID=102232 RepID=UPI0002AC0FC7|nr:DUF427 domain-containing protein [Gloeocapsa sp. PCC 73106]ELR98039.1 hypothetical protein GLO73106DRAFT_00018600 [Gloeocapsa sp. PCC 73106]